jgi:hypothetical protein
MALRGAALFSLCRLIAKKKQVDARKKEIRAFRDESPQSRQNKSDCWEVGVSPHFGNLRGPRNCFVSMCGPIFLVML